MPRKPGDFKRNDDIYDEVIYFISNKELYLSNLILFQLEDVTREHRTNARSLDVMTEEALILANYFPENQKFNFPDPGTQ